jgi:hypothetical protein
MLNYWLRDHHYQLDTKEKLFFGKQNWKLSERFPRMTLCKFDVFVQLNDKQAHWLQCTLPMNIFIEKIYIGIWFWLWFLLGVTTLGILITIVKALPYYRKSFIQKRIPSGFPSHGLYRFLGLDGVLTLRLLSSNTNDVNVTAIIKEFTSSSSNDEKK